MKKHLYSLHVDVDELHQRVASDWDLRALEREREKTDVTQRGEAGKAVCSESEIELSGC